MKIKTKKLLKFMEKASLNTTHLAINLDFKEDALYSSVKSIDNVALSYVTMLSKSFIEYEPIGQLFIKNTDTFIKGLKTMGEEITLTKNEDYNLNIKGDQREANIILGAEIICENVYKEDLPTIPTTTSIALTKTQLTPLLADKSLLGMGISSFVKVDNQLVCEVGVKGESDHYKTTIKTDSEGEGKVSVGNYFNEVCSVLDNEFTLSMGTDIPMVTKEVTEDITFVCIIAPVVYDE